MSDLTKRRFWERVIRTGGCWPWNGPTLKKDGRGVLCILGKNHTAPRVSWFVHHGHWPPDGVFVCHSCDNPNCVNPEHLWLGTNSDNLKDAANKGRLALQRDSSPILGERNGNSRLTNEDVLGIREAHRAWESIRGIARRLGRSFCSVQRVTSGSGWKHVK